MSLPRHGRLLAAAVAGAVTLLGVTACQSGPASTGESITKTSKAELTYAIWDETQKPGIQANIKSFNEQYPGIKVNLTVTPYDDYWTKLQTQASSNTLPDLFWMNSGYLLTYAGAGKLAPLEPLTKSGKIDLANYPTALVDSFKYDGVQYGAPKDFDTFAVWYNPALFKKAGVPEPRADWDWAAFTSAAEKLRAGLKSDGGYGVTAELTGFNTLFSSIWQAGGDVLADSGDTPAINSPQTVTAIKFWQTLVQAGAMPTPQQLSDTSALEWFTNGKTAMYVGGSFDRSAIVDSALGKQVQVAPQPAGTTRATITGGLAPVASAGGKHLAATRTLQAFLASKAAQQAQGDLGSIIPAFKGTQGGWLKTLPDTALSVFIDGVDYAKPAPVDASSNDWWTAIDENFVKALSGQQTAEQATERMDTAMKAAIEKTK